MAQSKEKVLGQWEAGEGGIAKVVLLGAGRGEAPRQLEEGEREQEAGKGCCLIPWRDAPEQQEGETCFCWVRTLLGNGWQFPSARGEERPIGVSS